MYSKLMFESLVFDRTAFAIVCMVLVLSITLFTANY